MNKKAIDEAEEIIEEQAVVIALLQEDNAELMAEVKHLKGVIAQMMVDRRVDYA